MFSHLDDIVFYKQHNQQYFVYNQVNKKFFISEHNNDKIYKSQQMKTKWTDTVIILLLYLDHTNARFDAYQITILHNL